MEKKYTGRCHCAAVEFEVTLPNGIDEVLRCNCSLCRRKGALMAAVPVEKLKLVKGEDQLSLYQWNTGVAKHYFCKTCGIYTHHQRRSNPMQFGFNIACIDGVDPASFKNITWVDGASL